MKISLKREEIIQQVLYALIGLAFITVLFASAQAHSQTSVDTTGGITLTGEITSIEGEGFSLKHENGMTLVSLRKLQSSKKDALAKADLIKTGNMVTVSGTLDKGSFNNPMLMATNLVVVGKTPPETGAQIVPAPSAPDPMTPAGQ